MVVRFVRAPESFALFAGLQIFCKPRVNTDFHKTNQFVHYRTRTDYQETDSWFKKLIDGYCQFIGYLIAAALAVMVVLVFGNVVMRYAFNSGFTVSEELSRWLFVWLTFLGAVIALRDNAHLGTDMLVGKLGPAGQAHLHGPVAAADAVLPVADLQGHVRPVHGQQGLREPGDGSLDGLVLRRGHGVFRA